MPQAPKLPPLPEGPDIARARAPIEQASQLDPILLTLAIVFTLLIVGLFTWLYKRSRTKAPETIAPEIAAAAEIEAAISMAKEPLAYTMLISKAVRRFLIARYQIKGGEGDTSSELITKLPLPPEEHTQLQNFLARCDGVKFAQQDLMDSERDEIATTAQQLVAKLKEEDPAS